MGRRPCRSTGYARHVADGEAFVALPAWWGLRLRPGPGLVAMFHVKQ